MKLLEYFLKGLMRIILVFMSLVLSPVIALILIGGGQNHLNDVVDYLNEKLG